MLLHYLVKVETPSHVLFIFTAQRHASMVYAVVVCLSVCLSVTGWCSIERAKRRITAQRHMIAQGL